MSRPRRQQPPSKVPSQEPSAPPSNPGPQELTITTRTTELSGPLPPASELQAYEDVLSGAAERIVSMAEQFASHTRELEAEAMRLERSDQRWGRGIAAGVVAAVLVACIHALHPDKEDFAITLGSWTIVALAGVFIAGRLPDWIANIRP